MQTNATGMDILQLANLVEAAPRVTMWLDGSRISPSDNILESGVYRDAVVHITEDLTGGGGKGGGGATGRVDGNGGEYRMSLHGTARGAAMPERQISVTLDGVTYTLIVTSSSTAIDLKAALALGHDTAPPVAHFETLNPKIAALPPGATVVAPGAGPRRPRRRPRGVHRRVAARRRVPCLVPIAAFDAVSRACSPGATPRAAMSIKRFWNCRWRAFLAKVRCPQETASYVC